jgi:glucose/mannose-6-phosphate isomerase
MTDFNSDFDKYNLRRVILDYPNQLDLGYSFSQDISLAQKNFSELVICGMGGSGLPGKFLREYLISGIKKPLSSIEICQSYQLPPSTDENSLVFISSYSGTTEETISCFHDALERNATIIAFASGGEVEKIAQENKVPFVRTKIDLDNFQPRYALTYTFAAMLQVLEGMGLKLRENLDFPVLDPRKLEVPGEELAQKTIRKTPVIYSSERFKILAEIWKIKINENAKTPAFWNFFPELNHNEMPGFTNPQAPFLMVMIKDPEDHPQIQKRIDITAELYREKGLEVEIVETQGSKWLEKALNLMTLADWHSYYLAYEYGQDPTPVEMVEALKVKLK